MDDPLYSLNSLCFTMHLWENVFFFIPKLHSKHRVDSTISLNTQNLNVLQRKTNVQRYLQNNNIVILLY